MIDSSQPAAAFLTKMESIFKAKASIYRAAPSNGDILEPAVLVFNDVPEKGYLTCVTYGLSFVNHEKWNKNKRPELLLSIKSNDVKWALLIADLALELRGEFPFSYGQRINLNKKIEGTNISYFLIFAPKIIESNQFLNIDIGLDYQICLTGIYPLTKGENDIIDLIGLEEFWKSDQFDLSNINK